MGFKALLSLPLATSTVKNIKKWASKPKETQQKVLESLIEGGKKTSFGKDHNFKEINSYQDFKSKVPLRTYEDLQPYINRVTQGVESVLWPGKPLYLAKTSVTTAGTKYIPITKDSIPNHIDSAKNALLSYIAETKDTSFVDGKMIFLQGSPILKKTAGINTGRLSGIVAHHVPQYLQKNRMPSWETNCIDDWEMKVSKIAEETSKHDMRLISGIPAWVQMYFEVLLKQTGKKNIKEIFPNFSLFVYGGVNFGPYRAAFKKLIGSEIASVETYPASEGFIAFQNSQKDDGLLMVLNKGIFYEFIPIDEVHNENPTRLAIWETELNQSYALVINNNAGLWGYLIGDVVKIVSLNPYKIRVVGRTKHFISAFGEHVIAEEVESTMEEVQSLFGCSVKEFHVAPQVSPEKGLPYHEWLIEFDVMPPNLDAFSNKIDSLMQSKNIYYKDLLDGNILRQVVITKIAPEGFTNFMKSRGKLGGQNKIPRLANDRSFADLLQNFKL